MKNSSTKNGKPNNLAKQKQNKTGSKKSVKAGGVKHSKPSTLDSNGQLFTATVDGHQRGFAFLQAEGFDKDFFVPASRLNGALHRDTVLARRVENTIDEAEVVKVLKRGYTQIVGLYTLSAGNRFVIADEKKFSKDIYIAEKPSLAVKNGQKVVVKILEYPADANLCPTGEVIQILGYAGEHQADMKSIAYAFGLRQDFPPRVENFASKIPSEVVVDSSRVDLRNEVIFTIDGEDAKDLDDAVSISTDNEGNFVLGVHIADVSHYVKPQDDIDKEAFERGTSVYLPEMVFPMLPTTLSNGVCSLFQQVDRLTLSCIMTVDKKGNVTNFEVVESVINSRHRMTYTAVQAILEGDKQLQKQYADIVPSLKQMQKLAQILIDKRNKRGNINFEEKEIQFVLNEKGETVDIVDKPRLFSHKLIEEFMILANETVAQYAFHCDIPFVYRTHEKPDSQKVEILYALLKGLGFAVKDTKEVHTHELQTILQKAESTPYFRLLNDVMLRTMQKAKYTTENIGHFGLQSECYCHFTSPIRRYPDLMVHRILKTLTRGKMTAKAIDAYTEYCSLTAVQSSQRERNAVDAERKADDLKKCQYAKNFIGQKFSGIISGVTENGIFVELANTVEGFIPAENLSLHSLVFDKAKFCLANPVVRYSLGDMLDVVIVSVNISATRIEMAVAN